MPARRSRRSKSKSRRTRGRKLSRCDKLLRKNIAKEIDAYRRGRFVSPKQAVAVAYAITRKSCGRSWRKGKSKSRSRKGRKTRR